VPRMKSAGYEVHEVPRSGTVTTNLADYNQVEYLLDNICPDAVVNLAALTDVDKCELYPQESYIINVRIVENLSTWILSRPHICQLVHVSTDHVYDGTGPHKESDVTLTNYYAFSKYASELAALQANAVVLRTNFFGPSECPHRLSLSDWVKRSIALCEAFTVFDDVLFSPLSTNSLCAFIIQVLSCPHPGLFNLGSSEGLSKADFAFTLASELGLPTTHMIRGLSSDTNMIAYRPNDMRMDCSSIQKTYGIILPKLTTEIQKLRTDHSWKSSV